jgi:hypothetical protein
MNERYHNGKYISDDNSAENGKKHNHSVAGRASVSADTVFEAN